jgi:hypothetical protein
MMMGACTTSLSAQDFYHAAGLRLGRTDGINYKHFLNADGALEVMLGFGGYDKGLQAYALYEWHRNIRLEFTDNLYVYYGVGGHAGYIVRDEEQLYYNGGDQPAVYSGSVTYFALGADAIAGLEYRIFQVPMTIGIDIKPYIEYYGFKDVQFKFWDIAFNIKYIF